ncbi:MAG: GNAT family N-acetyltransferase [Caulobacterales bacterium]
MIDTPRARLRPWRDSDRVAFTAMHADREVMWDYEDGPLIETESVAKLDRYKAAYDRLGFCRWALEDRHGVFLGYVGVMPSRPSHPLGDHFEIGWRLNRRAWGLGYATEGARAALADFFARHPVREVLSYTAPDNARSQAVMARLSLQRDASRDFSFGGWHGLVWVAKPTG